MINLTNTSAWLQCKYLQFCGEPELFAYKSLNPCLFLFSVGAVHSSLVMTSLLSRRRESYDRKANGKPMNRHQTNISAKTKTAGMSPPYGQRLVVSTPCNINITLVVVTHLGMVAMCTWSCLSLAQTSDKLRRHTGGTSFSCPHHTWPGRENTLTTGSPLLCRKDWTEK